MPVTSGTGPLSVCSPQRSDMPAVLRRPVEPAGVNRKCRKHVRNVANDLGCVKTCSREERGELFSLLSSFNSSRWCCWFYN